MSRGLFEAFKAWLPYPEYRFEGGPFDGQRRVVDLYETGRGMMPPRVWRIAEVPSWEPDMMTEGALLNNGYAVITAHEYEFVPTRSFNEGFYRFRAGPPSPL